MTAGHDQQIHPVAPPLLSVVIPTLGGDWLAGTIEYLNRGSVVPAEILICIPEAEAPRAEKLSFPNVRVVRTPCRGQVAQRAFGFQQARHDLVMQLDDDICVRADCVENMISSLQGSTDAAVGPKLYDRKTGEYHSFMIPTGKGWFEKFLFWIVNGAAGYEAGRIGRAGICMGIPEEPGDWHDIGWLPGGCVLHRRQNLVLFDFYPFKGKAFAEDLFHSVLLRRKGVSLMRSGAAACDVDFPPSASFRPFVVLKWYRAYARALTALVSNIGGSLPHLYFYLIVNFVGHVSRRMFRTNPKS